MSTGVFDDLLVYECPVCDYTSSSERGVKQHCGRVHTIEENPYRIQCECNNCGDVFTVPKSQYEKGVGKYCSVECRSEDGSIECECNYCGTEFSVAKSQYDGGSGKYCSNQCQYKQWTEDGTVKTECNYCGDEFVVEQSQYERGVGKYCSMECYSESGTVECECNYCGDKFTIWKYDYKQGLGKYCSNKCQGLDSRSSNPDMRKGVEYREFRRSVLERDNYECVDCGASDNLHVHHVIPIKKDDKKITDVDNGVTVCVSCHTDRHRERDDDGAVRLLESTI